MGAESRLLYVDPDVDTLATRAEVLADEYELAVQTASSLKAAKQHLKSSQVDCVVSNLSLTDETGFDFLSYVRTNHGSLPVILLTNDESESVIEDAFESGATDLFPEEMIEVSYDPLVDRIHQVIDSAATTETSEPAEQQESTADPTTDAAADTATDTADTATENAPDTAADSDSPDPDEILDDGIVETLEDSEDVDADEIDSEVLEASEIDLSKLQQLPRDALLSMLSKIIGEEQPANPDSDTAAESSAEDTSTTAGESSPDSAPAQPADSDDTAWEPTADERAEWESTADYHRPSGLSLSPGTTTLVQCGSQDKRKRAARLDLLGVTAESNRNVLLIQYRSLETDTLEAIATNAQRVTVITIGCSQTVPESVSEKVKRININNPNDVTRLGILATGVVKDWANVDGEITVSLDPLDVLFRYKSVKGTFRFLHIFLGKLSNAGAISHFSVNPSASDPRDINTLKPLFDHIMTIDDAGVDLEGS